MEAKTFYSRLFKRKINPDEKDFWQLLYAELLHRLREIDDLYCFCEHCQLNTNNLNRIIADMVKDSHIEDNYKPRNFAGQGYCKKKMQEDSERSARVYRKQKKEPQNINAPGFALPEGLGVNLNW